MPWQEESTMELRRQFIQDVLSGATPVSELCAAYQISRKTGYKWLARYDAGGVPALGDQSRRPARSPTATPPELVAALLAARGRHPRWGPRKLLRLLRQQLPTAPWPARSTLALHLKRAGLVQPPRRVRRPGHPGRPQAPMDAPNAVWTVDFKGQFRLGNGSRCYPSRSPTASAACSSAVATSPAPRSARAARSSCAPSRSTASRCEFARTTASHSPPKRSAGPRRCRSGGCGSGSPARSHRAHLAPAERPA
jgi:transposase-like protein